HLDPEASDEQQDALLAALLEQAVREGEDAVKRTPDQLEVLREAGVVDAGAHGLVVIMAGIVAGLRGDIAAPEVAHHAPPAGTRPHHESNRFRYCTNFIVTGAGLDGRSFVSRLEEIGDSVLVVGGEATIKVHVHTDEPDGAVALFEGAGKVSQLDVADMNAQVAERTARLLRSGRCSAVAVTSGAGVRELFQGMGAFAVDGGETFNPSIYDLLAAIHEVPSEEVLVLPNNPNVVLAAERAAELSDKDARVVDCTAPQAGLVALLELDPELGVEENAERLEAALVDLRLGSVAPAARDDARGRFVAGDAVGFIADEIVAWGGAGSTLATTMAGISEEAELVTVIGGAGAPIPLHELNGHAPEGVELELHEGGQANYWWLLAAE
ncbi:MAG: DAK2 domain-containing protein, partial [Actinomycetota bacterium]|nr:DAK2 domain-containing protein [Actinomycetota bacterium]